MKPNHLLLTFLILAFAILNCTGPPAAYAYDPMCEFYEEHNGVCCSDCHDMVSCATTNLFCVPSPISTPNSGEKPVVYDIRNSQAKDILACGCDAFIQKPFGMQELSGMIREILDKE